MLQLWFLQSTRNGSHATPVTVASRFHPHGWWSSTLSTCISVGMHLHLVTAPIEATRAAFFSAFCLTTTAGFHQLLLLSKRIGCKRHACVHLLRSTFGSHAACLGDLLSMPPVAGCHLGSGTRAGRQVRCAEALHTGQIRGHMLAGFSLRHAGTSCLACLSSGRLRNQLV